MNSLQLNFESLRQGPFKPVFEALEAGFREFGIALANHIFHALEQLLEGFSRKDILELYEADPTDRKISRWRLVLAIMDGIQKLPSK